MVLRRVTSGIYCLQRAAESNLTPPVGWRNADEKGGWMEVLKLFAPYGPGWLGGVLLALIAFYFGRQFLEEYKRQNERKAGIDLKREERKQAEVDERAQRDRERSQMEGRIAAQMERSNSLMEAMKTLMESVVASNEVLHNDLAHSQARSQGMAEKVDHICDRVDLIYSKESGR